MERISVMCLGSLAGSNPGTFTTHKRQSCMQQTHSVSDELKHKQGSTVHEGPQGSCQRTYEKLPAKKQSIGIDTICFLAKGRGESADKLHVKAAKVPPLFRLARYKQDSVISGTQSEPHKLPRWRGAEISTFPRALWGPDKLPAYIHPKADKGSCANHDCRIAGEARQASLAATEQGGPVELVGVPQVKCALLLAASVPEAALRFCIIGLGNAAAPHGVGLLGWLSLFLR